MTDGASTVVLREDDVFLLCECVILNALRAPWRMCALGAAILGVAKSMAIWEWTEECGSPAPALDKLCARKARENG